MTLGKIVKMGVHISIKSERGVSMLYVLAALIVTGFIGVGMVKMVTADRTSNAMYSTSESARSAARSGIVYAIQRLEDTARVDETLALLQAWIDTSITSNLTEDQQWLAGGSGDNYERIDGSSQQFRTRLLAFDTSNFNITLKSESIGEGGARASIISVYHLDGIEFTPKIVKGDTPINALQMDNSAFEFNVRLIVYGNTSVKGGVTINSAPATFHGTFRQDSITSGGVTQCGKILVTQDMKIDSNAYFSGVLQHNGGVVTLSGNAGFNGEVIYPGHKIKYGNWYSMSRKKYVFAGGTYIDWGGPFDLNYEKLEVYGNPSIYHHGLAGSFKNYHHIVSVTNPSNPVDVASKVGFSTEPDPEIFFNTAVLGTPHVTIDASTIYDASGQISATDLNNWYTANSTSLLNNTFLVVRVINTTSAFGVFKSSSTLFNGKAILWIDNGRNLVGDFIETTTSANLTVYVDENSTTEPHMKNSNYIRGFLYVNNAPSKFYFYHDGEFEGSVYASKNAKLKFDGGTYYTTTVTYNKDVINELALLGVFSDPKKSVTLTTKLKVNHSYTTPIAKLVSQSI